MPLCGGAVHCSLTRFAVCRVLAQRRRDRYGFSLGGRMPSGDGDLEFCLLVGGGVGFYGCICSWQGCQKYALSRILLETLFFR